MILPDRITLRNDGSNDPCDVIAYIIRLGGPVGPLGLGVRLLGSGLLIYSSVSFVYTHIRRGTYGLG